MKYGRWTDPDIGLDSRRALTDDDFRIVEGALFDHVAVVISDIEENADWLLDLGRRFGIVPLVPHVLDQYHHPETPEISIIAANTGGPESRDSFRPAGAYWHSDLSYMAEPSDAILLYSRQIPTDGGDTLVANMARAYEALPPATRQGSTDGWASTVTDRAAAGSRPASAPMSPKSSNTRWSASIPAPASGFSM